MDIGAERTGDLRLSTIARRYWTMIDNMLWLELSRNTVWGKYIRSVMCDLESGDLLSCYESVYPKASSTRKNA